MRTLPLALVATFLTAGTVLATTQPAAAITVPDGVIPIINSQSDKLAEQVPGVLASVPLKDTAKLPQPEWATPKLRTDPFMADNQDIAKGKPGTVTALGKTRYAKYGSAVATTKRIQLVPYPR